MKVLCLCVIILTAFSNPQIAGNDNSYIKSSANDSLKIIEKVYLHNDRDYYFPGDDIWFKAYLIDASTRLLSNHSRNLHVELISPTSKIVASRVVSLNGGVGNGDFRLSEYMPSGQYRIRAYTNYMRNFSDQLFFNKDITIINSSDTLKLFSDNIEYIKNKLDITFFPEGGSLVDNVTSRVAFKAVNALGKGCDVFGEIYSSKGEKITALKSTNRGMGSFSFKPLPELTYYAIVRNQYGDEIKTEIPGSFSTGIVFNISINESNELLVTFKTNTETLPIILDHDMSLAISARNIIFGTYSFRIKSLYSSLIIPTDDLPDGINMLTLSGNNNLPICERLVFLQNTEDIKVNLETSKTVYKHRDSVSVKLSYSGNSGIFQEAFLSLSATENHTIKGSSQFPSTISSWFLLESDIRGPVEEPSYYFDPSKANRLNDLDLLLLTQGWRDFEWKYKTNIYPPETGFKVSGRIRKLFTDGPLENSSVNIMIIKNERPVINTVPTDSSGRFCLEGIDITGNARLIASAIGKKGKFQGQLLLDSGCYSPAEVRYKVPQEKYLIYDSIYLKENIESIMQETERRKAIRKKYKLTDTINLDEVEIIGKRQKDAQISQINTSRLLYGKPDNELIVTPGLSHYFNIMQLIKTHIPGFHIAFSDSSGFDSGLRFRFFNQQPLFILDGMEVPYYLIMTIPLTWVDRIDFLKPGSAPAFGARGYYGVISVITRSGARSAIDDPVFHSVNLNFSGFNEPRIFYSPKHSAGLEADYNPDLRTTLYWNPNIKLINNKELLINYFNADNPSIIKVLVEGITTTGIPVTCTTEYEVR